MRKEKKKDLVKVLLITIFTWFVSFLYVYFIALMLNVNVGIDYIFLIMPLITLIELIPISVSGLGTREAAVIFFFSLIGIGAEVAVSFSLLYIITGGWLLALLGSFFWFKHPIKLK